ncbi:hypothetical protein N7491_000035 [Penicillium cf. griseofulvum]|uniref:Uncharacterized protein n=1 Tax=Penicillium cf. griseofulvum TaxID=2972120 RepID=A0A9W9JM47_9EURO|nr:hypothetical protein N7472_004613 [Penicillium cf. griseofulvum]KAJ5442175.1 hypothetical protein N7445_005182 [Penicillium cf. griseofulvum]KAJ5450853.1 hypothetical protein N7491_000035 [Penicillium cf. griseofulvum]
MKSIFTSLVYLLCFFTAMIEGLTRYKAMPPSDSIVLLNRQSLNDLAMAHPYGSLWPENGGYYLKDKDEAVIGIGSDDLCTELDAAFASADASAREAEAFESDVGPSVQ